MLFSVQNVYLDWKKLRQTIFCHLGSNGLPMANEYRNLLVNSSIIKFNLHHFTSSNGGPSQWWLFTMVALHVTLITVFTRSYFLPIFYIQMLSSQV